MSALWMTLLRVLDPKQAGNGISMTETMKKRAWLSASPNAEVSTISTSKPINHIAATVPSRGTLTQTLRILTPLRQ